jgi:hypothetical protein
MVQKKKGPASVSSLFEEDDCSENEEDNLLYQKVCRDIDSD